MTYLHAYQSGTSTQIASRVNDFQARVCSRARSSRQHFARVHTQPLNHCASSFIATGIDWNGPSRAPEALLVAFALPGSIVFTRNGQLHAFVFPTNLGATALVIVKRFRFSAIPRRRVTWCEGLDTEFLESRITISISKGKTDLNSNFRNWGVILNYIHTIQWYAIQQYNNYYYLMYNILIYIRYMI